MSDTPEQSRNVYLSNQQTTTQPLPDWQRISTNSLQQQQLKATLIQHVSPVAACEKTGLKACNTQFVSKLLNSSTLLRSEIEPLLEKLFEAQLAIYRQADISPNLRKRQYIQQSGLVLSPDYCVNTLKDTLRVGLFLKAITPGSPAPKPESFLW